MYIKSNLDVPGNEWSMKDRLIDLVLEFEIRIRLAVLVWASLEQKKGGRGNFSKSALGPLFFLLSRPPRVHLSLSLSSRSSSNAAPSIPTAMEAPKTSRFCLTQHKVPRISLFLTTNKSSGANLGANPKPSSCFQLNWWQFEAPNAWWSSNTQPSLQPLQLLYKLGLNL